MKESIDFRCTLGDANARAELFCSRLITLFPSSRENYINAADECRINFLHTSVVLGGLGTGMPLAEKIANFRICLNGSR